MKYAAVLFLLLSLALITGVSAMSPETWKDTARGGFTTLTSEDVDEVVEPYISNGTYPGVVVVLADPDGYTCYAYGVRNKTTGEAVDNQTTFEIGSVSKTFTGLLLADAAVRGLVNISSPVGSLLPDGITAPSYEGQEITLSDLATHTSGIPGVPDDFYAYAREEDPAWDQAESTFLAYGEMPAEAVYEWLNNLTLNRRPGDEWEYSNTGTAIVGDIVSRAEEQTYPELVRDHILGPLRMNSTDVRWNGELRERAATGYRGYAPAFDEGRELFFNDFWSSAGGIVSDGDDMAVYLAAWLELIDTPFADTLPVALEPRAIRSSDDDLWQSLFWDTVKTDDGTRIYLKAGETNRFQADVILIPERQTGLVILANTAYFIDNHVESDIAVPLLKLILEKTHNEP